MGAAVASSLCICPDVAGYAVIEATGADHINVYPAQARSMKSIPEYELNAEHESTALKEGTDSTEIETGTDLEVANTFTGCSEGTDFEKPVLRRLRSALGDDFGITKEVSVDDVCSRIADLHSRQANPEEVAWEYVRLAWRCIRGNFAEPLPQHPAAPSLLARSQALPLEQLDRNIHAMLSTFWEVPVIDGTQRDTRKGFVDPAIRSQLATLVGAPPFRLISWKQLKALGRIPRSSEGHALTLQEILQNKVANGEQLLDEKSNPMMQIYMISHTWSEGQPDGCYLGRPNAKATVLTAFGEYTEREFGREVWYWIDYSCIDQDNVQPGIRSLPLYVSSCSSFLVLYSENYESRAWTRLEQCLFMGIGTKPAMTAISVDNSWVPTMREDANGFEVFKCLHDPCEGALTCEGDREIIRHFVDLCQELWATGWIEDPGYWSGETPTANTTGAAKYGPGLRSVHSLCCGTTEVMVRRMGLANGELHVIRSHVDGTRRLSQR